MGTHTDNRFALRKFTLQKESTEWLFFKGFLNLIFLNLNFK